MPALKSASGLLPSAAENCFIRSSRELGERLGDRSRTRFCTDAALPSQKQLLELLGELAVLLAEHLVELRLEVLRDLARRSVNSLFSSRAAFSNSALTNSALAPACSRSSTRAPISTASRDRPDRIVAVLLAVADEADGALVLDDEAVDRDAVADHADVGLPEWSGCFHVD